MSLLLLLCVTLSAFFWKIFSFLPFWSQHSQIWSKKVESQELEVLNVLVVCTYTLEIFQVLMVLVFISGTWVFGFGSGDIGRLCLVGGDGFQGRDAKHSGRQHKPQVESDSETQAMRTSCVAKGEKQHKLCKVKKHRRDENTSTGSICLPIEETKNLRTAADRQFAEDTRQSKHPESRTAVDEKYAKQQSTDSYFVNFLPWLLT